MRLRSCSLLLVIVLLFAPLAFCAPQEKEMNVVQLRDQIIKKMKIKEGMEVDKEKMESLADKIIADHEKLSRYFYDENYVDMALLLKKRGAVLVTSQYKRISGKDSALLWKKGWIKGAKLKIETVVVYISDVMGLQTVQLARMDSEGKMSVETINFDNIAFVLQEIHIITEKEGSAPQNLTLVASSSYMHQDLCPWF